MTQEPFTPDIEQIKATSAKVKALCQRMDAEILILDDIIAQLEEENRRSLLYQYRLNRAKRLLNDNDV
jgi:DNA replication protein DnaC